MDILGNRIPTAIAARWKLKLLKLLVNNTPNPSVVCSCVWPKQRVRLIPSLQVHRNIYLKWKDSRKQYQPSAVRRSAS